LPEKNPLAGDVPRDAKRIPPRIAERERERERERRRRRRRKGKRSTDAYAAGRHERAHVYMDQRKRSFL
jgi:hypothetical protein